MAKVYNPSQSTNLESTTTTATIPPQHAHLTDHSRSDENNVIRYKLVNDGVYLAVEICITQNNGVKCASNTLITCSENVVLGKGQKGVDVQGCGCLCAGEEFSLDCFEVRKDEESIDRDGKILIAPQFQGELLFLDLDGEKSEWVVQQFCFFCADFSVDVGMRESSCLSGLSELAWNEQEMFLMKISGKGNLLLNATGSVIKYPLGEGEKRRIYRDYILAWENKTSVKVLTGKKSSLKRGVEFEFIGPGTIFVSTRPLPKNSNEELASCSCAILEAIWELASCFSC